MNAECNEDVTKMKDSTVVSQELSNMNTSENHYSLISTKYKGFKPLLLLHGNGGQGQGPLEVVRATEVHIPPTKAETGLQKREFLLLSNESKALFKQLTETRAKNSKLSAENSTIEKEVRSLKKQNEENVKKILEQEKEIKDLNEKLNRNFLISLTEKELK